MKGSELTLKEIRTLIGEFITSNNEGHRLWDILTCLRGPDFPSEKPSMSPAESSVAYDGRRKRKADTVEAIRAKAFFGKVGGAARYNLHQDWVELPPQSEWDHFDKHVWKAASVLGLAIRYREPVKPRWEVKVNVDSPKVDSPPPNSINSGKHQSKLYGIGCGDNLPSIQPWEEGYGDGLTKVVDHPTPAGYWKAVPHKGSVGAAALSLKIMEEANKKMGMGVQKITLPKKSTAWVDAYQTSQPSAYDAILNKKIDALKAKQKAMAEEAAAHHAKAQEDEPEEEPEIDEEEDDYSLGDEEDL